MKGDVFSLFLFIVIPAGLLGWSLGYNNMSTLFGPSVVADIVKYRTATILAGAFILIGALIGGRAGLGTVSSITTLTVQLAVSASIATTLTTLVMTYLSLPTSLTQGIFGAMVGIGMLTGNVNWPKLVEVVIFWGLTPFGAVLIAYLAHRFLSRYYNRIKSLRVRGSLIRILSVSFGIYAAYSLGANNLANVTGPFVGKGMLSDWWALVVGGAAMALGALTSSRKVIYTVGRGVTAMEPFDSAISIFAESTSLLIFSFIGIPISSAQAVIGAVVGVGLVKGTKMINSRMLFKIISGWIATPFVTAAIAVIIYLTLKHWG